MKLQTKLFRLISQPFESSAQRETRILREEKEKAIERFYQTMTKGVTLNTFNAVFAQYKQAGFEIRDRILRKKTEFVKFGRYIYVCY